MARFHSTPDGDIAFTSEEEASRDAEEKAWADGASERATKAAILSLEALETPRRLAESVLSDEGKAWLTANRDKIATERGKL